MSTHTRTRRVARTVAALLAIAAIAAGSARADETPDPRIRIQVTRVSPPSGVTVTLSQPAIAHLAPLLTLRNATGTTIELHDPDGIPFLRVGPGGVEGNARSAFLGSAVRPNDPPPPSPGGPEPLWQPRSGGDTVRWYDVRAAYEGHAPADQGKHATLRLFTIPGRIGTDTFAIDGAVTWQPVRGRVEATVTSVEPRAEGIAVRVVPGVVPAIELRNDSPRTIEITGRDDRPFARIGPDGVEVNERSATWRDTRSLSGEDPGEPRWVRQGSEVLIWLERRAAFDGEVPEDVQSGARAVRLGTWTVPGTIDGAAFRIQGETWWVPVASKPDDPATPARAWWPGAAIAGAAVIGAGGAVIAIRRRRHA